MVYYIYIFLSNQFYTWIKWVRITYKIDDKIRVEQVSVKISDIIVQAKIEKHVSLLDIGSVNIIKDKNILDYWEDESIPSGARLYYKYYYKVGDKNGQYKNTKW